MTNNNDKLILNLKEEIELREKEIKSKLREQKELVTNCIITMNFQEYNFHVMNTFDLLLAKANLIQIKQLTDQDKFQHFPFSLSEYIEDIDKIIGKKESLELSKELNIKKKRLEELLSSEAKQKNELEEIKKSLGL